MANDCPDCRGLHPFRTGTCSTCGRQMNGIGLEIPELPAWLDRRLAAWLRSKTPRDVALILALVPVLLPIPVISILICAVALFKEPSWPHARYWAPIPVIAILNIVLSVWFMVFLSGALWNALFHWWSMTPELIGHPARHGFSGTNI